MRVNHTPNSPVQDSGKATETKETHHARKGGHVEQVNSADLEGAASTEISGKGKDFAHAKEVADAAPDVREDKIAALKTKIASGKYHVEPDAIADRMVDEHIHMHGIG